MSERRTTCQISAASPDQVREIANLFLQLGEAHDSV